MAKKTTKKSSASASKDSNFLGFLYDAHKVHALAYFPYLIGPIVAYFFGNTDKKKAMHHIKYAALMAVGAIILIIVLNSFFAGIVNFGYWGISMYFAFKAYKGEKVQVEILDTIEDKISEKVKK